MAKLSTTPTATVTEETVLSPALRRKLVAGLAAYARLSDEKKVLEAKIKHHVEQLGALRDEAGGMSVKIEGAGTVTLVAGTHKKFNPRKFTANGGDLTIYNNSFDEKPSKPYNRVTLPGTPEESE